MYVDPNFKTKKALKEAVAKGDAVSIFSPGPFHAPVHGEATVEGPRLPQAAHVGGTGRHQGRPGRQGSVGLPTGGTMPITKMQPSRAQLATFEQALEVYEDVPAALVAEMDEDGTMLISLTEDELTTHARISRNGQLIGDWF